MDWKKRMLVVAIDFGTTYSGYAFSFRSDYEVNPTKVSTVNFEVDSMMMPKTPTCVLFTPDKEFHRFGYEAQKKYAELCANKKEANKWYFFHRFKLILHENMNMTTEEMLNSVTKSKRKPRQMPALKVFSAAIGYLKKHFLEQLQKQGSCVPDSEITWVLTVPAIWEDKGKDFMRHAALEAGIPEQQLMLALEPEAASVFCLEHYKSKQTLANPLDVIKPGKQFILADCGGGTIDIVAFKVEGGYKLKQLHRPMGTCQGGTKVDDAFENYLRDYMNNGGVTFIDEHEWLQLMSEFERVKRTQTTADKIPIKLPATIKEAVKRVIDEEASDSDNENGESEGEVSIVHNMMMLGRDQFRSFFKNPAMSIPRSIKDVQMHDKVKHVNAILLAGGFSESDVIQDAVREAFPRDLVLVAPSPSAAVLIGAVMYGHNPDIISTRVSAFTYGVGTRDIFKDGVHDKARLVIDKDGKRRCEDCFDVHITVDQEVKVNTLLPFQTYTPVTSDQTAMTFGIYRSTRREPLYVDEEGSEKIGTVTVLMPDTTGGRKREVKAAMMVGGTELKFFAVDETTRKEFTTKCDFLSKN